MCLAVPGRLVSVNDGEGVISFDGVTRRAELVLTPQARPGDMVLVHAGFVIAVLPPEEGRELAELTRQIQSFDAPPPAASRFDADEEDSS